MSLFPIQKGKTSLRDNWGIPCGCISASGDLLTCVLVPLLHSYLVLQPLLFLQSSCLLVYFTCWRGQGETSGPVCRGMWKERQQESLLLDKVSKNNQTSSLHISQGIKLLKIPLVVSLLLEGTKVENRKCERRDICPALYIPSVEKIYLITFVKLSKEYMT